MAKFYVTSCRGTFDRREIGTFTWISFWCRVTSRFWQTLQNCERQLVNQIRLERVMCASARIHFGELSDTFRRILRDDLCKRGNQAVHAEKALTRARALNDTARKVEIGKVMYQCDERIPTRSPTRDVLSWPGNLYGDTSPNGTRPNKCGTAVSLPWRRRY